VDLLYYLNLPEQVQFGANDNLRYTYDAAGNKLAKVVDGTVAGNNTRLDYSGNFLYENNELKAIFTSAGRIIPFDNGGETIFKFEYNLQDHLGNTRVVFSGHSNGQPEVMQVTDYYPFGMVMNQQNYFASGVLSNKYLYNNKELQDDELAGNSLGWYDYGKRFYDPALARWHSVDPRADKYFSNSLYNYCVNNPMLYVDPQGDTINISQDMLNNEQAIAAHNEWKTSRAGKQFYKKYGIGGKYEGVSVNLDIASGGDASGGITTFGVDKETGKATRIYPKRSLEAMKEDGYNIDGKRSSLKNGEYLKFNITFDPPNKYNSSEIQQRWNIRKGLTILHETQHARMMHKDILNYGYMYYSGADQHYFMKDTKLQHFQERFDYYREKQPSYTNEKINKIINSFEYGRY
jgi:RHS repeat-associated protein